MKFEVPFWGSLIMSKISLLDDDELFAYLWLGFAIIIAVTSYFSAKSGEGVK